ncbi:hypothetical protein C1637_08220 [Chryseobacterium lactis]|uniref:Uncharacterized protein n=1 Tax=Chryseobacterium lactis TaxID=1241981 RepID=A0A3G6RCQ9_CHRLC|nr:hypothetical protein [Chryseobacterium lactis]AZA82479.1 hypothetical protein EG342_11475 [Chryseobacterium lactis]AZB02861.1 hypothetical protein EG341_02335 [Chryseobacterium lactis]PNW13845.1 hypothetical protein C1637_08220 [Chryseobacterium lactis]
MGSLFENNKFEVEIQGLKIAVIEYTVKDQQVFRLLFNDGRPPLNISRAKTWNGEMWMSIPQGRQQEADVFGNEISKHLKE